MGASNNYVYILQCADGTLYTGWTNDIERRICAHNAGVGAKYTRTRVPVQLVYCEQVLTRGQALRREAQIKRLRRSEKLALIAQVSSQNRNKEKE